MAVPTFVHGSKTWIQKDTSANKIREAEMKLLICVERILGLKQRSSELWCSDSDWVWPTTEICREDEEIFAFRTVVKNIDNQAPVILILR
jgi:hypothetical protein